MIIILSKFGNRKNTALNRDILPWFAVKLVHETKI